MSSCSFAQCWGCAPSFGGDGYSAYSPSSTPEICRVHNLFMDRGGLEQAVNAKVRFGNILPSCAATFSASQSSRATLGLVG